MTTYPPPLSTSPALSDEATLEVAVDCLLEHLPIEMEGGYSPQDLFEILLRAASRGSNSKFKKARRSLRSEGMGSHRA